MRAPRDPRLSELRTTEQLADALGIGEHSVRRAILRGSLPPAEYRLGSGSRAKPLWHARTVAELVRERQAAAEARGWDTTGGGDE